MLFKRKENNSIEELKNCVGKITDQFYEVYQKNENIEKLLNKVIEFIKVNESIETQYEDLSERLESQVSDLEYSINKQDKLMDKCNELQDKYFELYTAFLSMQNSIRIMRATIDQHKNKGCGLEGRIGDYPTYISDFLDTILKIGEDL